MKIGVLGAGQLGRMMALAGYPLGFEFRFYDSAPDAPAGQVAPLVVGSFDDREALDRFASGLDVATYEFENVPVVSAEHLSQHVHVYPHFRALECSQDRVIEKQLFQKLGIPTPRFEPVDTTAALSGALLNVGLPAVLKTRRFGYDGKGQAVVGTLSEAEGAMDRLGGRNLIAEAMVNFQREVSVIACRGRDGHTVVYPIVENTHGGGILRQSIAPTPGATGARQEEARRYAGLILNALDYVGVLAIEFFDTGEQLLANEMAPRVHNSGHWTIEGAATSQFENHLRAITGLPLGATDVHGHAAMVNIIGGEPDPGHVLALGAHLHLYGKQPRPGRKLGHATITAETMPQLSARLEKLRELIERTNC